MGFIKVTPDALRSQSTQITTAAREVDELLTRLLGQVRELTEGWQGAGSTKFTQLYDEWQQGARMTKQGMEGIAAFLSSAAEQYQASDEAVAGSGS